jgi:hypothetical protein
MSMPSVVSHVSNPTAAKRPDPPTNPRAARLAQRLESGALALATFAATLTDREWVTPVPNDGRPIGVVVHHVASVYPLEIQLAQTVARGGAITGVTMDDVHRMNAAHAEEHAGVSKDAAIDFLYRHSKAAAAAIRALSDDELDRATTASLYDDAPVTCQFVLEDLGVRHSYHHLAVIRRALGR